MLRLLTICTGLATATLLSGWGSISYAKPDLDFDEKVLPFLQQHCFRCHGMDKQEGEFRMDNLSRDVAGGPAADQWIEVIERISSDEMPPEDEPNRPTAEQSEQVVRWLAARITEGEETRLARRQRVSFQRLTRTEYANTIYDLLGVDFDVAGPAGLNEDADWHGFERIGLVLSLSPSHVEKYFAAAEVILAEAYPAAIPKPIVFRNSALDLSGGPYTYGEEKYQQLKQSQLADRIRVDLWPGQLVMARLSQGVDAGQFKIRVQLSGLKPVGGRAPHMVIHDRSVDRLLFEQDVVTAEDEPLIVEFMTHLSAGQHEFTLTNEMSGPSIFSRLGRSSQKPFFSIKEGRVPWQLQVKDEQDRPLYPCLIVDWIECEGPFTSDNAKRKRASYVPSQDGNMDQIGLGLARFAARAFRRPLRPGEINKYVRLAEREIAAGVDTITAVKTSMLAILCSKDFLYLVQGSPDRNNNQLTDWELASRLSYFLWSTMPDDELLSFALNETLTQPRVLQAQLRRMLDDPKAQRFQDAFPSQWLQLKKVGMFPPNSELYPDYDKFLERSMVRETTAFFGEVLRQNMSLREFLVSDWTMLNARLAFHYDIPGVNGDRFQRVQLPAGHHRGGILTHAAILSLTSDGNRHRPVHRGVWISESIYGRSPPPPPANVDAIEPNPVDAPKPTIRQQLAAHTRNQNCIACHRQIDPLGLAFDSYDAIGRWRTEEVVATGIGSNPKVDASGTLPDGRSFSDASEFQHLLLEDIDQFNAAFVKKLATFALRRTMTVDDRDDLARIVAESKAKDYRLREIIEAMVLSDLFQKR